MRRCIDFCFFLFVFIVIIPRYTEAQSAVSGYADLSQKDVTKGQVNLSGQWAFYWNRLLTPDDLKVEQQSALINVPGSWHQHGEYATLGYGTYRLIVTLPLAQKGLSLYFPAINSSAKIWINGELAEETGRVSTNPHNYQAKLGPTIVSLPEHVAKIDIVVQVANFSYFSAGIAGAPVISQSSGFFSNIERSNGIENFFAGSLIAMFVYQLILFFLYQRGKPYLWLGLICLGVALRAMIVHSGSFLLPNLFPAVSWEIWKKIEFGCVYAIVALFPLYVYHLFSETSSPKPIYFFVSIASLLSLTVVFTPQYIYGQLLDVSHIALLLAFFYAVYSISRAWQAGNRDARIIMFGVLVSFPFILAEILKNTRLFSIDFNFAYFVEAGVLIFLLFQVYMLSNHFAVSYKNLEHINQNLEKMVEERSGQLVTANTVKDRLLSVISHDIKSPLNALRGMLQVYNKGAISKDEFDTYTKHLENDLSKTGMLVDNLLYWTASQLKGIEVKNELFDLHSAIEENVRLFDTIAGNKHIVIKHNAKHDTLVNTDRNILNLVLRNVISNAVKFSEDGSTVNVIVEMENGLLRIIVEDKGVGMDQTTIEKLFSPDVVVSARGTGNEKGAGIGLSLSHEYIRKAGGELIVESAKGKGSRFIIMLLQDNDRVDTND